MGCVLPACRHWTSLLYWLTPCWLRRYIYTHKPWEFLIPDSSPCATPCLLISYQVYGPRHTKCLPLSFSLSHVLMLTNEHHWSESSVQASPIAPPFGRCCHVQAGISLWMSNIAKGVSPSMGYRGKKASVPLPIDFFFIFIFCNREAFILTALQWGLNSSFKCLFAFLSLCTAAGMPKKASLLWTHIKHQPTSVKQKWHITVSQPRGTGMVE